MLMAEMCSQCGLPEELCVCEDMTADESGVIEADMNVTDRSGNTVTLLTGISLDKSELSDLGTDLRNVLGVGGSEFPNGDDDLDKPFVLLQGDHRNRVDDIEEVLDDYDVELSFVPS